MAKPSALLERCEMNTLVIGGFPYKWPTTRIVVVFFVNVNNIDKLLNKHSNFLWFETPRCSCDATIVGLIRNVPDYKGTTKESLQGHIDGLAKPAITPVRWQWSYCSLALSHGYLHTCMLYLLPGTISIPISSIYVRAWYRWRLDFCKGHYISV